MAADFTGVPKSLERLHKLFEKQIQLLEEKMLNSTGYNQNNTPQLKGLADTAKTLSVEARQWEKLARESTENLSVEDKIKVALRFLLGRSKGDRIEIYKQMQRAEAEINEGLRLNFSVLSTDVDDEV